MDNLDEYIMNKVKEYIKGNTQEIVNSILNAITEAYVCGFDEGVNFIMEFKKEDNSGEKV